MTDTADTADTADAAVETSARARPTPPPSPPRGQEQLSLREAASALRVLRYGAVDDSTHGFDLPPAVRATVSPVIAALRWSAVLYGMVFAAQDAATDGDLAVVYTLAIVLYLTTWRTFRPVRLANEHWTERFWPLFDGLVLGAAVGISAGFDSPFVFVVMAAAAVASFGWGLVMGILVLGVSLVAMAVVGLSSNAGMGLNDRQAYSILAAMVVVVGLAAFIRRVLLDAERRRQRLAGRIDMLTETNDLLHILNEVARTLPTSLDLRDALETTRVQLQEAFEASVVGLVIYEEADERWVPYLADGCALRPSASGAELPDRFSEALASPTGVLVAELDGKGLNKNSGSGVYTSLRTRGKVVGLLGVEHGNANQYGERELRIIDGLGEALALTVDNARWFRRLRTIGAEEERTRIARDLHDRLGQWLTYISFELERIMADETEQSTELDALYNDVQTAIEELRETLRQLRTGVSDDQSLAVVARELTSRFTERTGAEVTLRVSDPEARLRVPIENEVLRVLQEALNNVDKHAGASKVEVSWEVDNGRGVLTVKDNGEGFDAATGVGESAFGLIGMRERADVIGARLSVQSQPGRGTVVRLAAADDEEV